MAPIYQEEGEPKELAGGAQGHRASSARRQSSAACRSAKSGAGAEPEGRRQVAHASKATLHSAHRCWAPQARRS